jgi:hypothetical protein
MSDRTSPRPSARRRIAAALGVVVLISAAAMLPAASDGTETLGGPSVPIAPGNGVAVGGVGLFDGQPALLDVTVPADATVQQVLLYWSGFTAPWLPFPADDTIEVDGTEVPGTLIGGPTPFFSGVEGSAYRADITALDKVGPGPNSLSIGGLFNTYSNDGAGIVVIYSSPSQPAADIGLVDGHDLAFRDFASPLDTTVPQTFTFAASAVDRTVPLTLFAASVNDQRYRPNAVTVSSGASTQTFLDPFSSNQGREWDTVTLGATIPAGATSLTVQALSTADHAPGELPASFAWIAAAVVVPRDVPDEPGEGCTRTLGYWKTHSKYGPAPYDATWAKILPAGEDTPFFLSGKTYYEALWTQPAGGLVYWNLAHQYIAAELNVLAEASIPGDVLDAWLAAKAIFETYTPAQVGKANTALGAQAEALAGILDGYNNGLSGPGHCTESE